MATLQSMAANYDAAKASMPAAYAASKSRAVRNFNDGLSKLIGGPVSPAIAQKYDRKFDAGNYANGLSNVSGQEVVSRFAAKLRGQ